MVADEERPAGSPSRSSTELMAGGLQADDFLICLSDDFNNFRKDVCPHLQGQPHGRAPGPPLRHLKD